MTQAQEAATTSAVPTAGIYHYQQLVGEWPTRFHLRVDPDGGGLLLANAAQAAALSPVGVQMAQGVLEGRSDEAITRDVKRTFRRAADEQVVADLASVRGLIADLTMPGDNYPVANLGDVGLSAWERQLAAPLQADVTQGEPDTLRQIVHKLWQAGVPHVTIAVDPQAEAAQLPRIVEAAGDIGMLTGLRSVASWLSAEVIEAAAMAGLDHLDLLYVTGSPQEHDVIAGAGDYAKVLAGFEQCRALELCPVAQVPLIAGNADAVDEIAAELVERGVTNLVFFALACPDDDSQAQAAGALPARALPQVALLVEEAADDTMARYLWAPPVRFDNARSLAEQVRAGPRTAGDIAIRVAAEGSVFPPRGGPICAGNLLTDAWEQIWGNECFTRYRERLQAPTRCSDCPGLEICAADCPKDPRGWSDDTQLDA